MSAPDVRIRHEQEMAVLHEVAERTTTDPVAKRAHRELAHQHNAEAIRLAARTGGR